MTKEPDTNWYSATIQTSDLTATNIIFNDGDSNQTTDLTNIDASKPYFYGDDTSQYATRDEVEEIFNTYNLYDVLNSYVSDGVYTKRTAINVTESAKEDMASHFLGSVQLDRTTYFTETALLMCDYNGNVGEGTINSGYGTVTAENIEKVISDTKNSKAAIGDMTHFKYINGEAVYDYIVKNTHSNWEDKGVAGMEGFYTTARDFAAEGYFDESWVRTGQTFTHTINKEDEKSMSYLKDFLDVAAPCLLDTVINTEFFTVEKLVAKEIDGALHLQICLEEKTVEGKTVGATPVFAEAIIEKGHTKTYYFIDSNKWAPYYGSNISAFLWTEGGETNADWPGLNASWVQDNADGSKTWSIKVDLTKYENAIFSYEDNKTADIVLSYSNNVCTPASNTTGCQINWSSR